MSALHLPLLLQLQHWKPLCLHINTGVDLLATWPGPFTSMQAALRSCVGWVGAPTFT